MQKYSYILLLGFILFFSCTNKTKSLEPVKDCLPERKDIKTHQMKEGVVKEVMQGFFAITVGDSERYSPCNLDTKWKVDGKKVKFKGIEKEIFPNERRAATPFLLTEIKEVK